MTELRSLGIISEKQFLTLPENFSMIAFMSKTLTSGEKIEEMSFEKLSVESQDIRTRINKAKKGLNEFFVNREEIIDLMFLCAVAQEPLLLVGVPGTAKSDLITKFRDCLDIPKEDYFEYMLTRFTEPSEVMGPIDISEMKKGRYLRKVQGKLPTAQLVFLDEIFKSNSAILNSLLTVLNERKFYQDGQAVPVAMKILIAATNEIPEQEELGALKDRFAVKAITHSVQDTHFEQLIDSGLRGLTQKEQNLTPWKQGHANIGDILKANRYLTLQMAQENPTSKGTVLKDKDRYFKQEIMDEFKRIIKVLQKEDGIFISDRRIIKLYKLLRTQAWIQHGGSVERSDLKLLARLGETRDELALLEEKIPTILGL